MLTREQETIGLWASHIIDIGCSPKEAVRIARQIYELVQIPSDTKPEPKKEEK
jgi:hypothetical protein